MRYYTRYVIRAYETQLRLLIIAASSQRTSRSRSYPYLQGGRVLAVSCVVFIVVVVLFLSWHLVCCVAVCCVVVLFLLCLLCTVCVCVSDDLFLFTRIP